MQCSEDCETKYENVDQEGKNQEMAKLAYTLSRNQRFTKGEKLVSQLLSF